MGAVALPHLPVAVHAQSAPPPPSIDRPLSSRVERAVHLAGEPDWLATAGGWPWVRGAVWVRTCGSQRAIPAIDPDRASVTDTILVGMVNHDVDILWRIRAR